VARFDRALKAGVKPRGLNDIRIEQSVALESRGVRYCAHVALWFLESRCKEILAVVVSGSAPAGVRSDRSKAIVPTRMASADFRCADNRVFYGAAAGRHAAPCDVRRGLCVILSAWRAGRALESCARWG